MSKMETWRIISSLMLLGSFSVHADGSSLWEEFLKVPDKDALVILENAIGESAQRCDWGNPSNLSVAPTKKQAGRLFKLVSEGNESALRAALLMSRCLDGGELEDFYRSTGVFFEAQPRAFLKIIKEKEIPDSQTRYLLTMLPLDMVDDIDRQIRVVENRVLLLNGVDEVSFEEIRKRLLFSLEKAKENLDRIRPESKLKRSY